MTTITKDEFNNLRKPCVYIVFNGEDIIYIGSSRYGYTRIFHRHMPHELGRAQAFDKFTTIEVVWFQTNKEAIIEEERLIHINHPKYNNKCNVCYKSRWFKKKT